MNARRILIPLDGSELAEAALPVAESLETVAADLRARRAAILEAARTHEPDIIVIATSGRSGVRRIFRGSVAETVVRGTQTPVFLVRAGSTGRMTDRRTVSPP
ncbi:MAG TPA: universal stress protein [Methylomirabilota bacterium]|jgi:nucleotide-binding universal stress UspA family protein